jgi:hypothetical protein
MTKMPVKHGSAPSPALRDVLTSAADHAAEEKALRTRLAYRSDWRHFSAWCESVGAAPQADIADAFRAAFLSIAVFTAAGFCLALSIPLRRI